MEQLLNITTIPISIEFKINEPRFEFSDEVKMEIPKNAKSIAKIKPLKLNIDTMNSSKSIKSKDIGRELYSKFLKGSGAYYRATGEMAANGNFRLNVYMGEDGNIILPLTGKGSTPLELLPEAVREHYLNPFFPVTGNGENVPMPLSQEADFTIEYEMDKVIRDFHLSKGLKFVPGSIEVTIKEYPDVIFEYIGSPLYVPPSANPNYEPVDKTV